MNNTTLVNIGISVFCDIAIAFMFYDLGKQKMKLKMRKKKFEKMAEVASKTIELTNEQKKPERKELDKKATKEEKQVANEAYEKELREYNSFLSRMVGRTEALVEMI